MSTPTTKVSHTQIPHTKVRTAISPTRSEDYAEWYQQVIKAADLAENSSVRGCMVIKPWGWGIWENIRDALDRRIKELGHQNAYFPLFIPLSFLEKEAAHVEGFAKECAVITHHRLEQHNGKLHPAGELEEPLVVRPTSEAVIGDAFSRWVQSWRDLPLLINQWANVVRWEMRPRIFLRTTEFLWQEGHTAHATEEEARQETLTMLEEYRKLAEDLLALPVITGEKSEGERFPGAVNTYTIEAMMQDGKALQCGTSHYLGQNFAKAFSIRFNTKEGAVEHAYTTSWGVTTRMIGAMIMVHSDDDGLRLPPRVAPHQVVIIPVLTQPERNEEVLAFCKQLQRDLSRTECFDKKIACHVDQRDMRAGEKSWEWIKKGVPVRIEVGPKDIDNGNIVFSRRDEATKEKRVVPAAEVVKVVVDTLPAMQSNYLKQAVDFREKYTVTTIENFEQLKSFFSDENRQQTSQGFVLGKWCGDAKTEELLKELKVTIRCLPLQQRGGTAPCIITGKPATIDAIFAKSY